MTLSDTDLEARLRNELRARGDDVPPAPRALAELTRRRHRVLRRREYRFAGAALAAAVLLVGVPVVASTVATNSERGQTAGPGGSETLRPPDSELYDEPTRGGLAGDEDWLSGVAALPWWRDSPHRDPGMEFAEPGEDSRRVAYADDVPSGRVALVVGLSGREVVHAWFVGPRGADPSQMTVAAFPGMYGSDVVALVDGEPDADTLTLVVVARPEDLVMRPVVPLPDAEGNTPATSETLDLDDGIGVLEVERRWAESDATLFVQREDGSGIGVAVSASSRAEIGQPTEVDPADPRDQDRNREPSPWLAANTGQLLRSFGLTEEQARPTLLAAGPLGARRVGELVGITFPSGATGLWLTTYGSDNPDTGDDTVTGINLPFAPAGTDLLDRLVAVSTDGGLVVSAPSGVRADVLDAAGTVVDSVQLTDGGGTGPLTNSTGTSVRVVDGSGDVVAEILIEIVQ